ncbi:MAG: hypothetical protein OEM64_07280 [Gammaproteobacteria bacterium]|nr:hypothetical protein [Gammaproteobacteria bacterium]MDH3416092.1 hypothetical protein [Gammaproteobacteria bacterium]
MLKSIDRKVFLTALISAFLFVACSKSDDKGDTAVFSSDETILRYVAADTPYIFAATEPLPDDVLDKIEPHVDQMMASYQEILKAAISAHQKEMSEEERNSDDVQKLTAVVEEMTSLLSIEGLRGAGFSRESTGALYGNGLLPVIRWELSDGALFEAALSRIEDKAEQKLPVADIGEYSYRYFDADEVRFIIAVLDNQAVITLLPAGSDDAKTSLALGLTLPADSITDSDTLREIVKTYGYTNHYVGFFDFERIATRFTSEASGSDADLLALMDHDTAELSDVCRTEIQATAGIAPRMVMGYTTVDLNRFESSVIVELRSDIAAGLSQLPAVVPGLGGDHGGLLSFGFSLDVKAARDFFEARLDALEAEPYECELFADLQNGIAGGREALNQPVPPMVYDFRGFLAVIDDIEGLDIGSQAPPTSIDGRFMLAMDNAQALVSMGAMFSPEVAELNLQADGKPVPLKNAQIQSMGFSPYAAMTEDAIAIGLGDDAEKDLQKMLAAEAKEPAPLMSFSMDAARYYSFIGDAVAMAEQDDDGKAPPPEIQAAVNDIMDVISELYDRMSVDVDLTERGIELESSVTLKD